MRYLTFALAAWLTAAAAFAQQTPQALFEAGLYEQALGAFGPELGNPAADPNGHFLATQIGLRMEQPARTAANVAALTGGADPAWRLVGESVQALNQGDAARAAELATQATAANPALFAGFYQLGLARTRTDDWAGAAAAFEQAVQLNPSFAYSSYYAGLAYSRVKRADKTAEHFERFLQLAPNAPERTAVQSVMRTLRGR